jgi:hypothetical protein
LAAPIRWTEAQRSATFCDLMAAVHTLPAMKYLPADAGMAGFTVRVAAATLINQPRGH